MKWSVQKELDKNFKLLDYFYLEPESFTDNGNPYSIRTVFQIWVKKDSIYDMFYTDLIDGEYYQLMRKVEQSDMILRKVLK